MTASASTPKVYVIGGLLPRGGAFMAYHIGLLLQRRFGYELVNVQIEGTLPPFQFEYELLPQTISAEEMDKIATSEDLLVVNPAYSRYMFGLRLPCRSISYVQGFRAFQVLDCNYDLYVSVSTVVQDFLRSVYGIETPVIPPFVQLERLPKVLPWRERPPRSAAIYIKDSNEHEIAAQYVLSKMYELMPDLDIQRYKERGISHADFMQRLGSVRYLVNISLAEGFGLIPLEAMALGTCVTGLHALGGKDYMQFGHNSMTCSAREIDRVPGIVKQLVEDDALAETLATQAIADAQRYTLAAFRTSWAETLKTFLEK